MPKFKKKLVVFFACFAVGSILTLSIYVLPFFFPKRSGRVLEKWEVGKGEIKIYVTAYAEKNSFVPGAYYVFETEDIMNKKIEIMTFRHDDPVPINKNGVFFLNNNVAYVFMGWMYAVTINGGKTWSVWNAEKNLQDWNCCNYSLIKSIDLKEDGTGIMYLTGANNEIKTTLKTIDYGQTWAMIK